MFETDQYRTGRHRETPVPLEHPYPLRDDVAAMSLLVWGEHCTECAAPSCYKTCDLYEARPDTRCRRFRYGVYKNPRFPSVRGYGAEVAFKKWGVIGTMGNTAMESASRLIWKERFLLIAARAANAVGPLIYRITKDERWNYPTFWLTRRLSTWLHHRNRGQTKPDAFVLEVYNPGPEQVNMQLRMDYDPQGREKLQRGSKDLHQIAPVSPRFHAIVKFPPGHSRYEFERRLFQHFTESGLPFNISLTPEADTSATLVFILADFVTYRQKKAGGGSLPAVKCVVWDLDNTLWNGTLIEDDDVKLKPKVREILETLDRRGILLSIASKNDHESAWQQLQALGVAEFFLAPQINWKPKSENIRTIAKKLNIGIDTIAFIDDNPFELSEVSTAIPEVQCIDCKDMDELERGERFQGSKTADATNRRRYYQEAFVREEKQEEFGEDYRRFLEYCEIHLEIAAYQEEKFDRVAELIQRTNQLNFSGRKYGRDDLRKVLDEPDVEKYILYCSDRFGSYGMIGFGLVRNSGSEIHILDLMLSCRVQGKMIEETFFAHLSERHNPRGATRLWVNFNETKRNQPARQTLEAAQFEKLEDGFAREIRAGEGGVVQVTCLAECESGKQADGYGEPLSANSPRGR